MRTADSRTRHRLLWLALQVSLAAMPVSALGHGVAGQRFFPTTFAVDDPFMNDEFSLLLHSASTNGQPGEPRVRTTSLGVGYAKTILPGFGLQLDENYLWVNTAGEGTATGFGNLGLTLKYQFLTNATHEMILSLGISGEFGSTGAARVGAESFSTISPTFFFGKGFGDLPASLDLLRPLAVTGVVGASVPTVGSKDGVANSSTLNWAFTVQYSLMYLQSAVKDIGLGPPFNRLLAVLEVPLQTCLNAGCGSQTSWTINPGIIWIGKYVELGAAAEIPVNTQPPMGIGLFMLVHLFIDDLFPGSVGRPLFP